MLVLGLGENPANILPATILDIPSSVFVLISIIVACSGLSSLIYGFVTFVGWLLSKMREK